MARHHLFNEGYSNPVRPRSQMSGDQRKRSASKKSARAMAKSHRRQADASYDAMLEAQDDAWEGGEYQGNYAYEGYSNPFHVTPGGTAVGSRTHYKERKYAGSLQRRAAMDEFHRDVAFRAAELESQGRKAPRVVETSHLPGRPMYSVSIPGKKAQHFTSKKRAQKYLESEYAGVALPTVRNPFVVTPKGQAIGSHDLPNYTRLRGAALAEREGRVARGAMALEAKGTTLRIEQVGNQYQIVDHYGTPTGKYAYSLNKARDMLDRMLAGRE